MLGLVCTDLALMQSIMCTRWLCEATAAGILCSMKLTVSADQKSWLHRRRASALASEVARFPSHQYSPAAKSAPYHYWLSAYRAAEINAELW